MDQFKSFANNFNNNNESSNTNTAAPVDNNTPVDNNAPADAGHAPVAGGSNTAPAGNAGTAGTAQKEDYLDKGLDSVQKKFGFTQSRETNEKITDGARGMFEKFTGKKVPEKFSN